MTETGEPSSKSTPITWKAGKVIRVCLHILRFDRTKVTLDCGKTESLLASKYHLKNAVFYYKRDRFY